MTNLVQLAIKDGNGAAQSLNVAPQAGGYYAYVFAPYQDTPVGFQTLSVGGSAVALTIPSGAVYCDIFVETAGVRYRDDGTAPTASVGCPLLVGTAKLRYNGSLSTIQFIAISGTASLSISYYK